MAGPQAMVACGVLVGVGDSAIGSTHATAIETIAPPSRKVTLINALRIERVIQDLPPRKRLVAWPGNVPETGYATVILAVG